MKELSAVGKTAEVSIVASSTERASGESHTLRTSMTPVIPGNHTVAANVSLGLGDDTASEGFSYLGNPISGAAVPDPGNTMNFGDESPDRDRDQRPGRRRASAGVRWIPSNDKWSSGNRLHLNGAVALN